MATSIEGGYSASVQGEKIHLSRNVQEKDIDQAAVAPAGFGVVDRRTPTSLGCKKKVKSNYGVTSCLAGQVPDCGRCHRSKGDFSFWVATSRTGVNEGAGSLKGNLQQQEVAVAP